MTNTPSDYGRWRQAALDLQPNSALGQLTQMIAHDLNNHLQSMVLHLELLKPLGAQDEKANKHIVRITEAVEHAESVMRYLHEVRTKIDKTSMTNVEVVVEGLVLLLNGTFKRAQCVCETSFQSELLLVAMPMIVVHQAMLNVVMNAIESAPHGGVVKIEAYREGDHVIVNVCDTGPGLNEDDAQRVTEPFFTTKGKDHIGLGMTVVQELLTAHGGSFALGKMDSGGERVTLTLPASKQR